MSYQPPHLTWVQPLTWERLTPPSQNENRTAVQYGNCTVCVWGKKWSLCGPRCISVYCVCSPTSAAAASRFQVFNLGSAPGAAWCSTMLVRTSPPHLSVMLPVRAGLSDYVVNPEPCLHVRLVSGIETLHAGIKKWFIDSNFQPQVMSSLLFWFECFWQRLCPLNELNLDGCLWWQSVDRALKLAAPGRF